MIVTAKIKKPTLLLDEEKCRRNISAMSTKAALSGVNFRPHFKTHQSLTIGEWFRDAGTQSITVSSITMAGHFSRSDWKDITVAFPFNLREAEETRQLARKSDINILVTDPEHYSLVRASVKDCGLFLKINTGNNRSGTDWDDTEQLERIRSLAETKPNLMLKGILTHAGHAYKASEEKEIIDIYNETVSRLNSVSKLFEGHDLIISSGDTPCCSVISRFDGLDEIRPGNFVFYDLMQMNIGSCNREQVAVTVACPVVEKNRKRDEVIIYGGGVHLSKDSLKLRDGRVVYGQVVLLGKDGWFFPEKDVYLRSISQEHGIISASAEFMKNTAIGDIVGIIPVHSCMTADLLREYHTFDGKVISDFSPK
ncbi:MAG TPA: alanine racemase [Bacteroidales bacterium]|nr:alanine racemase [Bacteroidales bacterium]